MVAHLIAAGHIADGHVDQRSILDVESNDLEGFTQCHFFAGIGVWSHALRLAGWPDTAPVWTGSCPCQPFSNVGKKTGLEDERHLWPAWFDLIRKRRPPVVFGEQVEAAIRYGWLDVVQDDVESVGYAFAAVGLPASCVGAPHIRQRLWFVADAGRAGLERHAGNGAQKQERAGAIGSTAQTSTQPDRPDADPLDGFWRDADWLLCNDERWRAVEPGTFPLADGAANRVGRLRAYGNAIVAPVAAEFIVAFMECRP